jgi:hypothetical protein
LNERDLNLLSHKSGAIKTQSQTKVDTLKKIEMASLSKTQISVKTGEILNLINGVKKLELKQMELAKQKSKAEEANRWELLMS